MDPASAIGTASAVIGFAEITINGVQLATELVRRMREPPEYIKDTLEALELLRNIQRDIKASTLTQGENGGKIVIKACENCNEIVNELQEKLEVIAKSAGDGKFQKFTMALKSMVHESGIKEQLSKLEKAKGTLALALGLPSTMARTMATEMARTVDKSLKLAIKTLPADAFSHCFNTAASAIPSDQSGIDMFLRDLCVEKPQDIRQRLIRGKGDRVDGTCSWVLEHEAYQSWLTGTEQGLWINGDPGKGKTMISIFLTQELERHTAKSDGVFLYFFCDNQVSKLSTQLGFIQSLIHQLCLAMPPLASHCLTEYQRHGRLASTTTETLWRCARAMLEDFKEGPVFVLIDGLDECDAKSVVEICQELASLHTLSSDKQQKVRPVIISRPLDAKCGRHLAKFRQLQLNGANKHIGHDLSIFIHSRVRTIAEQNGYKNALHESVLKTVLRKSEGTFLWAGFVLSDLEDTETVDVERCLASLPPRLDDIYDRILQKIPEDKTAVVAKILKWVVLAVRPLTVPELAAAISTGPGETPPTAELINARIRMCRHLLSISEDVVKLVHQSARDFLTSGNQPSPIPPRFFINARQAHSEITQLCISKMTGRLEAAKFSDIFVATSGVNLYSTFDGFLSGDPASATFTTRPTLEPILGYSIEYWQQHARLSDGWDPVHDDFVSTFLKSKSCQNWIHLLRQANRIPCPKDVLFPSEIYLAFFLGLKGIVGALISKGEFDVEHWSVFEHPESTLVCAGLLGGQTDTVKILVEGGNASVCHGSSTRPSFFSCPIHIAAATNNVPALELLLNKRADIVNWVDNKGWTPLHHAAFLDSVEACQYLISKGANVDVLDDARRTPLYYAALPARATRKFCSKDILSDTYKDFLKASPAILAATDLKGGRPRDTSTVQVLLRARASPNLAHGTEGRFTVLSIVTALGRVQEVRALVGAGADVSAKIGMGQTALYEVLRNTCNETAANEIATILLDAGAELDPEIELQRPFILSAIAIKSLPLVKLAIKLGADVEYIDKHGNSSLYYAAHTGCKEIVDELLNAGVNINSGYPPLSAAAAQGHWELYKYSLGKGAQLTDDNGRAWVFTISSLAIKYDPSIVEAMISAGANQNKILGSLGTPLIIAIMVGSHKVVVDLLANRANVNLNLGIETALTAALYTEHEQIVTTLLAAGAKTASGISPLGYVSINGADELVDFLISHEGADPNEVTNTGYTPIEMASAMRHEDVVAVLTRAGADLSMLSSNRMLALSKAASDDRVQVMHVLMKDDMVEMPDKPVGQIEISNTVSEARGYTQRRCEKTSSHLYSLQSIYLEFLDDKVPAMNGVRR